MSVKNEHNLKVDPDIKIKIELNDDGSKVGDGNTEVNAAVDTEPKVLIEERPVFLCTNCNLTERYDCFGDRVPFNRNVRTKVDYYLARDPFTPRNKRQFLILGSVCSVCDKDVCVKPECSIFYYKFFCSCCARKNIEEFPPSIQEKIKTTKRI